MNRFLILNKVIFFAIICAIIIATCFVFFSGNNNERIQALAFDENLKFSYVTRNYKNVLLCETKLVANGYDFVELSEKLDFNVVWLNDPVGGRLVQDYILVEKESISSESTTVIFKIYILKYIEVECDFTLNVWLIDEPSIKCSTDIRKNERPAFFSVDDDDTFHFEFVDGNYMRYLNGSEQPLYPFCYEYNDTFKLMFNDILLPGYSKKASPKQLTYSISEKGIVRVHFVYNKANSSDFYHCNLNIDRSTFMNNLLHEPISIYQQPSDLSLITYNKRVKFFDEYTLKALLVDINSNFSLLELDSSSIVKSSSLDSPSGNMLTSESAIKSLFTEICNLIPNNNVLYDLNYINLDRNSGYVKYGTYVTLTLTEPLYNHEFSATYIFRENNSLGPLNMPSSVVF